MEQMKDNLPEVDMEKLRIVLDVKERYLSGALPLATTGTLLSLLLGAALLGVRCAPLARLAV